MSQVVTEQSEIQTVSTPKGTLEIRRKWCKGCSLCVDACPKKVLGLDQLAKIEVLNPSQCISCGSCEGICPDFAIKVIKNV